MAQCHIGEEEVQHKVAHYWESGTGWKWELLQGKLSFESMVKLAPVVLQDDARSVDKAEWSAGGGGRFTVKRAYKLARGQFAGHIWEGWCLIWGLKVQE